MSHNVDNTNNTITPIAERISARLARMARSTSIVEVEFETPAHRSTSRDVGTNTSKRTLEEIATPRYATVAALQTSEEPIVVGPRSSSVTSESRLRLVEPSPLFSSPDEPPLKRARSDTIVGPPPVVVTGTQAPVGSQEGSSSQSGAFPIMTQSNPLPTPVAQEAGLEEEDEEEGQPEPEETVAKPRYPGYDPNTVLHVHDALAGKEPEEIGLAIAYANLMKRAHESFEFLKGAESVLRRLEPRIRPEFIPHISGSDAAFIEEARNVFNQGMGGAASLSLNLAIDGVGVSVTVSKDKKSSTNTINKADLSAIYGVALGSGFLKEELHSGIGIETKITGGPKPVTSSIKAEGGVQIKYNRNVWPKELKQTQVMQ